MSQLLSLFAVTTVVAIGVTDDDDVEDDKRCIAGHCSVATVHGRRQKENLEKKVCFVEYYYLF